MNTTPPFRYGLVAVAVLAAAVAACGPEAVGDAETFLIYDRDSDSGEYRLFERSIETLDSIQSGDGEFANIRAGGQIKLNNPQVQSGSEIADSIAIEQDGTPQIDYSVRDDGTVVAWDYHSTMMLTLYHHIERANQYFRSVGVDKSRMGKVPVYYYVRLQLFIPIDLLTDNAAYAFTLDAFLIPPQLALKDLPLAANRGVIVHEYSHLVFNRLVHGDARAPAYLADDWPDAATNRMRSIDEGVADIFAGLQTEDPNFISPSISEDLFDIDRDLSKERHYDEELKKDIETESMQSGYNPYRLGSVIASTVWALRSATDLSDDQIGQSVIGTLRQLSDAGPVTLTTARFFNELLDQLPDDERSTACAVFTDRLDAIRGDLSCL